MLARQRIVLFEFKTVRGRRGAGKALPQLKDRGYERKHLASGKPVHWVGVEFSIKDRNVAYLQRETAGTEEAGAAPPPGSPQRRHTLRFLDRHPTQQRTPGRFRHAQVQPLAQAQSQPFPLAAANRDSGPWPAPCKQPPRSPQPSQGM